MSTNQIGDFEAGILKTTNPALSNDVDFFPGVRAAMGAWTHDQYRSRPRRPQGRQPDMGRSVQYILLDRPDDADRRVIMMQILPFADRQALRAYRQFERRICRALGSA